MIASYPVRSVWHKVTNTCGQVNAASSWTVQQNTRVFTQLSEEEPSSPDNLQKIYTATAAATSIAEPSWTSEDRNITEIQFVFGPCPCFDNILIVGTLFWKSLIICRRSFSQVGEPDRLGLSKTRRVTHPNCSRSSSGLEPHSFPDFCCLWPIIF